MIMKLFRVTNYKPELESGGDKSRLQLCRALVVVVLAILNPSKSYIISSSVEPAKKLAGFPEIWAQVVLGIRFIYYELFFRPDHMSRVGYPFELYKKRKPVTDSSLMKKWFYTFRPFSHIDRFARNAFC